MYQFTRKRFIPLNLLSILALGAAVLVSSRLSTIFAIFTLLLLIISKSNVKIKAAHIIVILVIWLIHIPPIRLSSHSIGGSSL